MLDGGIRDGGEELNEILLIGLGVVCNEERGLLHALDLCRDLVLLGRRWSCSCGSGEEYFGE